jgi:hypothetical protein
VEARNTNLEIGNNLSIYVKREANKEHPYREDLPNAKRLVASCPTNNSMWEIA